MLPLPARALNVPTVVSRWSTLSPIAVPATRRRALAVTSWSASLVVVTTSASRMLPPVAVMLTLPSASSTSPTVTLVAAFKRAWAAAPVLRNTLVKCCVMAPAAASTSMLPLPAPVLVVLMSADRLKVTLAVASTLTLPLPLLTSALAVMLLPAPPVSVCSKTLPLPSAATAEFSVMSPPRDTRTMCPLVVAALDNPPCVELVVKLEDPSESTRWAFTVKEVTVTASVSVTNTPPDPPTAVRFEIVVSRWLLPLPMPEDEPAVSSSPAAVMSTSVSPAVSPSITLPALAVTLTLAVPAASVSIVMSPAAARSSRLPLFVEVCVPCAIVMCRPASTSTVLPDS